MYFTVTSFYTYNSNNTDNNNNTNKKKIIIIIKRGITIKPQY